MLRRISVLLGSVLLVMVLAGPASAATYTRYYKNQATGRCLNGNTAKAVYTSAGTTCSHSNLFQTWLVTPVSGSTTSLYRNKAVGYCLDSNASGNVYLNPCGSGNSYQRWTYYSDGAGHYLLKNVGTGRCLDSNSAGTVYTRACVSTNTFQRWYNW